MTNDSVMYLAGFQARLPDTYRLLASANLRLHPRVTQVTLHGSRGLKGGFRPDSDAGSPRNKPIPKARECRPGFGGYF